MIFKLECVLLLGFVWKNLEAASFADSDSTIKLNDGSSAADKFEAFVRLYNKSYADEAEKLTRFNNFQKSLKSIDELQRTDEGSATYGINQFSDMSDEEFLGRFADSQMPEWEPDSELDSSVSRGLVNDTKDEQVRLPPDSFDWRDTEMLTEVRFQFDCNAPYAFATVGMTEILHSVYSNPKRIIELSDQQVIDCSRNQGCNGGVPGKALKFIKNTGIVEKRNYPSTRNHGPCRSYPNRRHYKISVYSEKKPRKARNGEVDIRDQIEKCPVVVVINAEFLRHYNGGVAAPAEAQCKRKLGKHLFSMLAVGYDTQPRSEEQPEDQPYYILRGSLGTGWGERGYMRMLRGSKICGIGYWYLYGKIDI